MNRRLQLFWKYMCNNRIEEYIKILEWALKNDYQIISLIKYVEGEYDNNKKILILRHDVDHISGGTRRMFEAEKECGAYSSYYFRDSQYDETTAEEHLMNEIEKYGSEASLHYETIANYIKKESIKTREELLNSDYLSKCKELLENELQTFRKKYNVPCKTIASHGTVHNTAVGVSNNYLTEDVSVYEKLGIKLEAYNKSFIENLGIYISDIPIEINEGYRYAVSPMEAINQGLTPILFLSHPNHWHYTPWQQIRKMVKSILLGPQTMQGKFVRLIN